MYGLRKVIKNDVLKEDVVCCKKEGSPLGYMSDNKLVKRVKARVVCRED